MYEKERSTCIRQVTIMINQMKRKEVLMTLALCEKNQDVNVHCNENKILNFMSGKRAFC